MAGGSGKSAGSTGASNTLDDLVKQLMGESAPARTELFSQISEALRTGGIGARIPIIGRSVEASKSAESSALTGTSASLDKSGLGGTPFGQAILASTRLSGETATNAIPTNVAQAFIGAAPGVISGTTGAAVSGATSASAQATSEQISNSQTAIQLFESMFGAGGQIGGSIGSGYGLGKGLATAAAA